MIYIDTNIMAPYMDEAYTNHAKAAKLITKPSGRRANSVKDQHWLN